MVKEIGMKMILIITEETEVGEYLVNPEEVMKTSTRILMIQAVGKVRAEARAADMDMMKMLIAIQEEDLEA